jgi:hypothetical protein
MKTLTKIDVRQAMDSLRTTGKIATLVAIRAALGNRGSMSTLLKLKAQIDPEAPQNDPEKGLK